MMWNRLMTLETSHIVALVGIALNSGLIPAFVALYRASNRTAEQLARIDERLQAGAKTHSHLETELSELRARITAVELDVARVKAKLGIA